MTDTQVMQDPYKSAIQGEKRVVHRFDHGIDVSINLSHVLLAIAVIAGIYYYKTRVSGSNSDDTDTPKNVIDTTEDIQ